MSRYLVKAKPKKERLRELRRRLDSGEISQMNPFGITLNLSLRNAKIDDEGIALWEEEDYCTPSLAMERAAVLDHHFDDLKVEAVSMGIEWKKIAGKALLWSLMIETE